MSSVRYARVETRAAAPRYLGLPSKRPFDYLVSELESTVFHTSNHAVGFPSGDSVWFRFVEGDDDEKDGVAKDKQDGAEKNRDHGGEQRQSEGEREYKAPEDLKDGDSLVPMVVTSSVSMTSEAVSMTRMTRTPPSPPPPPSHTSPKPHAAAPSPAPAVRLYIYPPGRIPRGVRGHEGDSTSRRDAAPPTRPCASGVSSCVSLEEKPSSGRANAYTDYRSSDCILDGASNSQGRAQRQRQPAAEIPAPRRVLKQAAAAKKALIVRLRTRAAEVDRLRKRVEKEKALRRKWIQKKRAQRQRERVRRERFRQKQAAREAKKAKRALLAKLKCKVLTHVNYPPESEVESGSVLTKTWLVKNTGAVAWPQGTSVCVVSRGAVSFVRTVALPLLKPNEEGQVSVELKVPLEREGRLKTSVHSLAYDGSRFGEKLSTTVYSEAREDPIEVKSTEEVTLKCCIQTLLVRKQALSVRLVAWPLIRALEVGRQFLPVAMNALPKVDHWAVMIGQVYIEVGGTNKRHPNTRIRMAQTAMRDEKGIDGAAKGLGRCFEEIVGVNDVSAAAIFQFCQDYVRKTPRYKFHSTNCQKFAIELIKFATRNRHSRLPPVCGSTVYTYATRPSAHAREGEGKASVGRCEARGAYVGVQADGPEASFSVKNGAVLDAKAGSAGLQVLNAQVEVGLQLRTGIAMRNGSVELNLLGFGIKLGRNFGVSTPFLWVDTE